jgi:hypothetical protein
VPVRAGADLVKVPALKGSASREGSFLYIVPLDPALKGWACGGTCWSTYHPFFPIAYPIIAPGVYETGSALFAGNSSYNTYSLALRSLEIQ